MVDSRRCSSPAALLSLGFVLAGCTASNASNSAPDVGTIPLQITSGGGSAFSIDLSTFVTDKEGGALTYAVTSGGGSFTGAVYGHTFDTIGNYTVQFGVTDAAGETTTASFNVIVQTANLAVVAEGDDLALLDTDTKMLRTVTGAAGFTDSFQASLSTGVLIYQRAQSTTRLFAYDPSNTDTTTLGSSVDFNTAFGAKTSSDLVAFTQTSVSDPVDSDLFVWNPETGVITTIAATAGEPDGNPLVTTTNLIYYESGLPTDIHSYDPSTDTSTLVSDAATAETLRAVLPNDSVVFSRVGGGGELDLFYFAPGTGLVEIGSDLSATVQAQTKTYRGTTTDSRVVFEVTDPGGIDLYIWNPSGGASTVIASGANDEIFKATTALDEIVYEVVNGPTDHDVSIYTPSGDTNRSIAATGIHETYQGALSNGDVVILQETGGGGDDLSLYDTSGSSLAGLATTGTDDYAFNAVLPNDKVAYTRAGGSGGVFVVNTTGAPSPTLVGAPGSTFAGVAGTGGDFVVQTTVSAQLDLVLWDESATSVVSVSSTTGDDTFGAAASNGDILFSRMVPGKTTTDLYTWNPGTAMETRLTDGSVDNAVVMTYSADKS